MRWRTILVLIGIVLGALVVTNPGDADMRGALPVEMAQNPALKVSRTNYAIFSVFRVEAPAQGPAPPQCYFGAAHQIIPLRSC